MNDRIEIDGERILLRQLTESEITDEMMSWFSDPELMRYYTNSGRLIGKEELSQSIKEGIRLDNNYTFGIVLKQEKRVIGTLKLGLINKVHSFSDLATLIGDRSFSGKGLATEAIRYATAYAFEKLGVRRMATCMYESNLSSVKAYLKAGWVVEGRLKKFYVVNGIAEDKILMGCYNNIYFTPEEIQEIKDRSHLYYHD